MPTYEYACTACGHEFEEFQSIMAKPVTKCPKCGKRKVKRLISAGAGFIFKGSGFYATDYRSDSYKADAKGDVAPVKTDSTPAKTDGTPAKTDGGKGGTESAKTETTPVKAETKAETKAPAASEPKASTSSAKHSRR